jgi:hypothetical protein
MSDFAAMGLARVVKFAKSAREFFKFTLHELAIFRNYVPDRVEFLTFAK